MSVAEAQEQVDSREFAAWQAYDRIEPFGEARADLRSAVVACVIANANRGKGQPFVPADFMPKFDPPRKQTAEELQARLFLFAEVHNGTLKK